LYEYIGGTYDGGSAGSVEVTAKRVDIGRPALKSLVQPQQLKIKP
jgi:hypothetical protein